MSKEIKTQVVVLGAGPAGYSAAFRCADLGLETVIVERYSTLGGVCLNVGCIPSKALLHVAKVIEEAKHAEKNGITFGEPNIDLDKVRAGKEAVVSKLTGGLAGMAKARKVTVVEGLAAFTDPNTLVARDRDGNPTTIKFDNAIIAAGSRPIQLPFIPHEDPRVWDSTDALKLKEVPKKLLIMGGGIIGLEMGTVYNALGSEVEVVEMFDQVIPAADKDVVAIYTKQIEKKFKLMLETKVTAVEAKDDGIYVSMEGKACNDTKRYDAVLVAIGRVPNGKLIDAGKAGVNVDDRGFIAVDKQMRTNVPHIFAIGDIVGQPMLAHKGVHEGHVAAEVIAGQKHYFDPKVIPSIAYTEPEVAWVGKTEKECKQEGLNYEVAKFPWAASGRAIASECSEGMTKLIFDKDTHRLLGGAIVGSNGGELLGEIGLAIEMGCDAEDIALTIHAHPTLHESVGLAAEVFEGSITDLPNAKAKKR
ncbi:MULTISPECIES: dihydrolipoyl dehydrogenase [Actinobacillus]|uniref:Dihydrolipoyl dehydrogenase n=5 Tax=Actinobacillus TaxID=713 RepID=A3N0D3_ACTP2|nr:MULTISPECIES: dihydrolipoyl dehydrogenase [Actinobacillus]ABN73869.1 dihydrolipoyl dehydrogenase [Actinobacillus pleuropneumoniae serovar 5b str. L20]ACE61484.1 dihydrolipoyl dehydrogenase [Actinobacillus pleuropneumoniae serovar 7 str. AP76]EFL79834.1 dihydrolipoamide dehydrogenase [Actinobacillus pleuropneumoniae serovar 6 str. Femo]EFM92281.1 Dihydrolipoyl dehydrogenase [Actinobacillus pleuropneumoniae serovar 6 str. Femo]EFM96747.1 Dihydrolipoyl dehydrogenase [Actinobacillus pleuropneum